MVRRIWTVLRSRAPFVRAVPKITSWSLVSLVAGLMLALAGCRGVPDVALTDLTEARRLMADLRIQFTKAADASNRAVMADTDEQSIAFAHEAEQATAAVGNDAAALAPRLHDLGYPPEVRLLEEFNKHFANYRTLDHDVLQLAVENTNLKAQRLSFGPVREAADAFRDALEPLGAKAKDHCRVESLAAKAVLVYDSYAQFASDIQSGAISPAYKWVLYDPEEWPQTPVAEQLNPSKYLTQFGQLAHAHGYKVIEAPARDLGNVARSGSACPELAGEDLDHWYIRCDIAGTAAAASDVVVVQDQVNTTNPAEYASLFNNARQQALAANPQVIADSELSTNYGRAGQMAAAAKSVNADGFYVSITSPAIGQADQFFKLMRAAGY